ncbi:hypothetical protein [Polycladidibacter hongkongensis]|uniref:hypothetical protein n=1 Tax=Polycladidibacter hongkongensis TaxID=1647556 RepID=UPI0008363FDC|nr:hypothetical protein [Pseudovibrio hongkongensis]
MTQHLSQFLKIACIGLLLLVAACAERGSYNPLSQELLLPTGRKIPQIKGSAYDCKSAHAAGHAATVWHAFVSGRVLSDEPSYNVSSEACFASQQQCEAYLYFMNGELDQIIISRCQYGYS